MNRAQMYKDVGGYSEILGAKPSQLISLLFNKLELDLEAAKMALNAGDTIKKAERITHAFAVIDHLRESLDFQATPDIAATIDAYYIRLEALLFKANAQNDMALLVDCLTVLKNIKVWWESLL